MVNPELDCIFHLFVNDLSSFVFPDRQACEPCCRLVHGEKQGPALRERAFCYRKDKTHKTKTIGDDVVRRSHGRKATTKHAMRQLRKRCQAHLPAAPPPSSPPGTKLASPSGMETSRRKRSQDQLQALLRSACAPAGQICRRRQPPLSLNHLENRDEHANRARKTGAAAYRKDGCKNGRCF